MGRNISLSGKPQQDAPVSSILCLIGQWGECQHWKAVAIPKHRLETKMLTVIILLAVLAFIIKASIRPRNFPPGKISLSFHRSFRVLIMKNILTVSLIKVGQHNWDYNLICYVYSICLLFHFRRLSWYFFGAGIARSKLSEAFLIIAIRCKG